MPCLKGGAGANIQIGVPPENLDTTIPASEGPADYGYMEDMASDFMTAVWDTRGSTVYLVSNIFLQA